MVKRQPKARKAPKKSKAPATRQRKAAKAGSKQENARLKRELAEALERQKATGEILAVISRSTFDLQTVLDTLTESAARLCDADMATVARQDANGFYNVTNYNFPVDWVEYSKSFRMQPGRGGLVGRALLAGAPVQVADVLADPEYTYLDQQKRAGFRTLLTAPLLRDGQPTGVFILGRKTVRPFDDKQVALVSTFADQAVIAIENARLFDEVNARTEDLRESLQQQTATADVLKVISRSTFDLQVVLDTLVESATRLCEADHAWLFQRDGDLLRFKSSFGHGTATHERIRQLFLRREVPINRGSITGRSAFEARVVHVADVLQDSEYTWSEAQQIGGYRAALGAPLLRDGNVVGVIFIAKVRPQPFTDKQIELVTTFADQAVIAIENVRLFDDLQVRTRDLTESLQQQTATADVLKVISRSAFDLNSVLSTLVASAARLCEAERGLIFLREGNFFRTAANFGFSPELEAFARANPLPADGKSTTARAGVLGSPVQAVDLLADETQGFLAREYQRLGGHRTNLGVPLRRDGETIGVFTLTRQVVQAFTPRQIELVQTFADQAVIAIENSRLLEQVQAKTRDLEESLRQQTATADVLKAISRSAFDLETVLNALIEAAALLCGADQGTIARQQGEAFVRVASWGFSQEFKDMVRTTAVAPERGSATGRALLERRTVHIPNVYDDPEYTFADARRLGGFKSIIAVPMLREGAPTGVLALTRIEEKAFTPRQIELVTTFADQAAIAIENVRLFEDVQHRTRELSRSLEELRAAQDRLIQTEKLASLGQLTAGIAHEIKNPLNFVNNFSALSIELIAELDEVLLPASLDGKTREDVGELTQMLKGNLEKVVQHGKRADSIVKNMLLHSREGAGDRRAVDINALVGESLNLAYHGARAENQDFRIKLDQNLDPTAGAAEVLPQEITRVLLNLISNGFYAAMKRKAEGTANGFEPTLIAITKNLGDRVEICIRDNGGGIPPDVKAKMFNPFFTTKPPGEGTGLGLSLSHDIVVKQHAGSIEVETRVGEFTEFRVVLPRMTASAQPQKA